MKTYETEELRKLYEYYGNNDDIYVRSDKLEAFASELTEDGEEEEDIYKSLLEDIELDLAGHRRIDCDWQGDHYRYIWEKAGCTEVRPNAKQWLWENYLECEGGMDFREYVEIESESDPGFFRWLFNDDELSDFFCTVAQKESFAELLNSL